MAQTKTETDSTTKRAPRILAGTVPAATDGARAQVLAHYEAALRLMQEGKYEKAHAAFDKMLAAGAGELGDRVRMYANACLLQAAKGKNTFASHEEHYDYAISLLNDGHYEDAREQFKVILKENDKADYAFYGLAVLASMTGDSHQLPGTPDGGDPSESAEPDPGACGLGLSGYGGRSALHGAALSGSVMGSHLVHLHPSM